VRTGIGALIGRFAPPAEMEWRLCDGRLAPPPVRLYAALRRMAALLRTHGRFAFSPPFVHSRYIQ
jgi:hypothetical protein